MHEMPRAGEGEGKGLDRHQARADADADAASEVQNSTTSLLVVLPLWENSVFLGECILFSSSPRYAFPPCVPYADSAFLVGGERLSDVFIWLPPLSLHGYFFR